MKKFALIAIFIISCMATELECVIQIQEIFTPAHTSDLIGVLLNSGFGINQFGDIKGCELQPNLKYVSVGVGMKKTGLILASIGECLPKDCATEEILNPMMAILEKEA